MDSSGHASDLHITSTQLAKYPAAREGGNWNFLASLFKAHLEKRERKTKALRT
jgi:hypothetical protein